MDCKTASGVMMNYMDNAMAEGQLDALQGHIKECEGCHEGWKGTIEIKGLLEGMAWQDPGEDFNVKVMNAIDHSLYQTTTQQRPGKAIGGLQPVLWSLFLYMMVIGMVREMETAVIAYGLLPYSEKIILLGSMLSRFTEAMVSILNYPRQMILALLGSFGSVSFGGLLLYAMSLLNLTALLAIIQITLLKMLNVKGIVEED